MSPNGKFRVLADHVVRPNSLALAASDEGGDDEDAPEPTPRQIWQTVIGLVCSGSPWRVSC